MCSAAYQQHAVTMSTVSVRGKGGITDIEKPDMILDYNRNKTGVDRADQRAITHSNRRPSNGRKLFFRLFVHDCMAVVHSYMTLKEMRGRKNTLCNFINAVGKALVEKEGESELSHPTLSTSLIQTSAHHFPSKIQPTPGKKRLQKKYCNVYSDKENVKTTDSKVGLCLEMCRVL